MGTFGYGSSSASKFMEVPDWDEDTNTPELDGALFATPSAEAIAGELIGTPGQSKKRRKKRRSKAVQHVATADEDEDVVDPEPEPPKQPLPKKQRREQKPEAVEFSRLSLQAAEVPLVKGK